jgi:hypothetical protein
MALGELQGILAALQQSSARKQAAGQQASLDAFRQQQAKAENDRIKVETQRAQDEHDYHQQLMDSSKSLRSLQLQEKVNDINRVGALPQGSTPLNGANSDEGGQYQLPPAYNDPMGRDTIANVPSDTAFFKHQADLSEIANGPKNRAAAALDSQKAAEALEKQKQLQMEIDQRNKDNNSNRQLMRDMQDNTLKTVKAMSANNANPAIAPQDLAQDVHDLLNGNTTREQIQSKYSGKLAPNKVAVLNAAAQNGVPFTNKSQKNIQELQKFVENINILDNVIGQMPDTGTGPLSYVSAMAHAPSLKMNQVFNSGLKQLDANVPNFTVLQSGANRFNALEMNHIAGGYKPSATTPKSEAISNRDAYLKEGQKVLDNMNLPPQQKAIIAQKVGLDNLMSYGATQRSKESQAKIDAALPPIQGQQ